MPPPVIAPTRPTFNGLRTNPLSAKRTIDEKVQGLSSSNIISFPTDVPKYYMLIIENQWLNRFGFDENYALRSRLRPERAYRLPLPNQLTDGHEINYDHNFNWLGILKNLAGSATLGLGSSFGDLGRGFLGGLGFSVNQFKMVTLEAPAFRQFSMEWKLSPRNFNESSLIRGIYLGIKRGMHPGATYGKILFHFPKIYWIGFYPNAGWLFKFKPCVIQGCQIDYQGGNPQPSFYADDVHFDPSDEFSYSKNPPESILLRLSFLELEYWINTDFNNAELHAPFDSSNWFEFGDTRPNQGGDPAIHGLGVDGNPT